MKINPFSAAILAAGLEASCLPSSIKRFPNSNSAHQPISRSPHPQKVEFPANSHPKSLISCDLLPAPATVAAKSVSPSATLAFSIQPLAFPIVPASSHPIPLISCDVPPAPANSCRLLPSRETPQKPPIYRFVPRPTLHPISSFPSLASVQESQETPTPFALVSNPLAFSIQPLALPPFHPRKYCLSTPQPFIPEPLGPFIGSFVENFVDQQIHTHWLHHRLPANRLDDPSPASTKGPYILPFYILFIYSRGLTPLLQPPVLRFVSFALGVGKARFKSGHFPGGREMSGRDARLTRRRGRLTLQTKNALEDLQRIRNLDLPTGAG